MVAGQDFNPGAMTPMHILLDSKLKTLLSIRSLSLIPLCWVSTVPFTYYISIASLTRLQDA